MTLVYGFLEIVSQLVIHFPSRKSATETLREKEDEYDARYDSMSREVWSSGPFISYQALGIRSDPVQIFEFFVLGIKMARAKTIGQSEAEVKTEMLSNVSLRRTVTPNDIAEMVLFLCSSGGFNISGQSLSVCGNVETM